MIQITDNHPAGDDRSDGDQRNANHPTPRPRTPRKTRGIPSYPPAASQDLAGFLNPAQVAAMWGVSHDKVLEFIRTGELEAFNVASKTSRRPQYKIPVAALKVFQERRAGRDPARCLPPPPARRSPRKLPPPATGDYF